MAHTLIVLIINVDDSKDVPRTIRATEAVGEPLDAPSAAAKPTAPRPPGPPRISIVIPLYNHREFIEHTLTSVMEQALRPAEIIVVDDGSTDDSAQIMARLVQRYPNIIFWSHPNQGAHYTLNAAIHRATGEFVSILNSDDVYHPQRLEYCVRALRDHPNAGAVFTGVSFIDGHGHALSNDWYSQAVAFYEQDPDLSLALANANLVVSTSNLFLRRSVFAEIGYFAPLRYTHDMDFCLRLLAYGKEILFEDRTLLAYRIHGSNTIAEDRERIDIERAAVLAFFLLQRYRHRTNSGDATWSSYLTRFTDILDGQLLARLVAYFLSLLKGIAEDEVDQLFMGPDAQLRSFLDATAIDWLSRVEQAGPAKELSEGLLRQRVAHTDTIRGLQDAIAWHAKQNESLLRQLSLHEDSNQALQDAIAWHTKQNDRLLELLKEKDAMITELTAWIATLEEARDWLAAQNQSLEQRPQALDAINTGSSG